MSHCVGSPWRADAFARALERESSSLQRRRPRVNVVPPLARVGLIRRSCVSFLP